MHHAQTFTGKRYAILRINDYYFGALILYVLFVGVFIPNLYIISHVWLNSFKLPCSAVSFNDTFKEDVASVNFILEAKKDLSVLTVDFKYRRINNSNDQILTTGK